MLIGVPKETKAHKSRVGLTPPSMREVAARGHRVIVERNASRAIGFGDMDDETAGAEIADSAGEIFDRAELIVKVKEPQPDEIVLLHEGRILFTYLHLAPDPEQAEGLLDSGCSAIAYETVTDRRGRLPLLAPMSEVAGRMAVHACATCLKIAHGGRGVLIGGVPGVAPGKVVVIGGGVVGGNALICRHRHGRQRHGNRPRPVPARGTRQPVQEPDYDALLQPDEHR